MCMGEPNISPTNIALSFLEAINKLMCPGVCPGVWNAVIPGAISFIASCNVFFEPSAAIGLNS